MNKFHEVSDKYENFVSMVEVERNHRSATFTFKDGEKKEFKTPNEAEQYVKAKYRLG